MRVSLVIILFHHIIMIFLSGSARIPTNLVQVSDIQSKANSYVIVQKVINLFQQSEQGGINNVYRYTLPLRTTGFLTLAFLWRFFFQYISRFIYSNQLGTRAAFGFCFVLFYLIISPLCVSSNYLLLLL